MSSSGQHPVKHPSRHPVRNAALAAVLVAAATVATWWAWLGWDSEYDVDPVTQVVSGPYQPWQVAGCGVCLIVIAVVGALRTQPWLVALTLTLSFTLTWSLQASSADDSGLWAVGALFLLVGLSMSSTTVAYGAWLARWLARGGLQAANPTPGQRPAGA